MRYLRFYDISLEGEDGWFYCELDEENYMQRQVKVFGSKMYWATLYTEKDDHYIFTDQPRFNFTHFGTTDGDLEISASEFEIIWKRSQLNS
jgi:hypothetical protein